MDISKLTQEQQWGLAYKTQQANEAVKARSAMIVEQNKRIEEENKNLIVKKPLVPVQAEQTVEEYVAAKLAEMGDEGYRTIVEVKFASAKTKALALPPDQLAALLEQFQIPDAIKS